VKEEESEIFPEAKDSDIDLEALGRKLAQRKIELSGEAGAAVPSTRKGSTATKRHARASSRAKTAHRRTARGKKSS